MTQSLRREMFNCGIYLVHCALLVERRVEDSLVKKTETLEKCIFLLDSFVVTVERNDIVIPREIAKK